MGSQREQAVQAGALPDPRLDYGYFLQEVETRVGPQRQRVGLRQTLPWFGTRQLREQSATESARAARQEVEIQRLQLARKVKDAYYEYWYLGRATTITDQHAQLVLNLEHIARTRFKSGTLPHSTIIQAQLELGKLEEQRVSLAALNAPLVASLNALLNRPLASPIARPPQIPTNKLTFTDHELYASFTQRNPELQRLTFLAEQQLDGIDLARKRRYPDITLGFDYIDTGEARTPDVPDSGKDAVVAMLSLNLPLWQPAYRAAERQAHFQHAAIAAQRTERQQQLESQLLLAIYHYRDAERKRDLYTNTLLPKARQALTVTQQSFETGASGFLDLIDLQRTLLTFELARDRALANRGIRLAEIEALIHRDISAQTEPQTQGEQK